MSTKDTLARKYRPKILSDLVGQESVVKTLTHAIEQNKLHQSYLFVGMFGCGKTTAARILAAMENCTVSPGINPCGTCDVCARVYEGKHTDIEEVDAAGKFGKVDQARKLKEAVLYRPVDGAKTKYYILDECHRMSPESNDALLKLLEEPPDHVRFILCTTDVQKLRPAIQSRCQRHDFKKIYWRVIQEQLELVAKQEKFDVEQSALSLCARLSQGSMRNALMSLEKLRTYSGSPPATLAHAQSMFGTPADMMYYDLFDEAIGLNGGKIDATKGYRIINDMFSGGAEFGIIYDGVAEHLRSVMIGLSSSKADEFLFLSDTGKERLKVQIQKVHEAGKLNAVLYSLKMLHESAKAVALNLSPETALEQWFVETVCAFRRK